MIKKYFVLLTGLLAAFTPGCASAGQQATTVYHNGVVITMNDAMPIAESVAVRDGLVLSVGTFESVLQDAGPDATRIDLEGKALLPGFFDSHGHAYSIGLQASTANLLPPPDGPGADTQSIQKILRDWAASNAQAVERVGWIAGFGYDDSQLAEQRHPIRDDLDAVSTERPVIIIHQSGHIGVVNSKALEIAGITDATKNPPGGVFRRRASSDEPNGVCEEVAFFTVLMKLAERFDESINEFLVIRGTELAASYGYTTVQEGRATSGAISAMRRVADKDLLRVDLVAYADILAVDEIVPEQEYTNGFRVGGAKLTIDGSPQGKTAWLTKPYFIVPEGLDADYRGYSAISEQITRESVEKSFANSWQLLCHANGDAAIDVFIEAVRDARTSHPEADTRPVLIHGQTLRHDQVAELDDLGIFPSLFPMHTFYWGDWHRESVLGPERAENISPTGWVLERGMMFGSHHDAPVALPDSMRVLSATVTRRSRTGDILGPVHRVPVMTALKSMTLWPAWQHFEEHKKGSIEPGKLADFVVLSENPLDVPEDRLAGLFVVETIKDGSTIYRRPESVGSVHSPASFGLAVHKHDTTNMSFLKRFRVEPVCGDGCFGHGLAILHAAFAPDHNKVSQTLETTDAALPKKVTSP